jgi:hypothetical protein
MSSLGGKDGQSPFDGWIPLDLPSGGPVDAEKPVKGWERIRGYLAPNIPGIHGTETITKVHLDVEFFDDRDSGIHVRRRGEMSLEGCQDCWGCNVATTDKTLVVTDGVGNSLCASWAAQEVADKVATDFDAQIDDFKLFDEESLDAEIDQIEVNEYQKSAWKKFVDEGSIASTTMIAVNHENEKLRYRKVGDAGFILFHIQRKGVVGVEARFDALDALAPSQLVWSKNENKWVLNGEEESGVIDVRTGDICISFCDGLLKTTMFKNLSREQIVATFQKLVTEKLVMASRKADISQNIADGLLDNETGDVSDDVTVGVMML